MSRRAVGYVRVSSRGQEERGAGLAVQRERVRGYAAVHGFELVDLVEETASGAVHEGELTSLTHRPILAALIERAQAHDFDAVIVPSFDRLSRDQIDAAFVKRWFRTYGVDCISAAGETNGAEGPLGELIDRIVGAIHEFDRKRILERMRDGKLERRREGRRTEGTAPYGYRLVPADAEGAKVLRPTSRRSHVQRIFRDAARGKTPGQIATALNEESVPPPTRARTRKTTSGEQRLKGKWNRTTVRNIIENRAYLGELHGVAGRHPAIVTPRLWADANRALRRRARGDATGQPQPKATGKRRTPKK